MGDYTDECGFSNEYNTVATDVLSHILSSGARKRPYYPRTGDVVEFNGHGYTMNQTRKRHDGGLTVYLQCMMRRLSECKGRGKLVTDSDGGNRVFTSMHAHNHAPPVLEMERRRLKCRLKRAIEEAHSRMTLQEIFEEVVQGSDIVSFKEMRSFMYKMRSKKEAVPQ